MNKLNHQVLWDWFQQRDVLTKTIQEIWHLQRDHSEAQQLQASGVIEQHERLDCDEDPMEVDVCRPANGALYICQLGIQDIEGRERVTKRSLRAVLGNHNFEEPPYHQIQSVTLRSSKSFGQVKNFVLWTTDIIFLYM